MTEVVWGCLHRRPE